MLYHGSKHQFNQFLSPEQTGIFRDGEEDRSHHRDYTFLTSHIQEALRYAGTEGFLYVVNSPNVKVYDQSGKKKPVIRKSVFVARPDDVTIVLRLKLVSRKRNQLQEFKID